MPLMVRAVVAVVAAIAEEQQVLGPNMAAPPVEVKAEVQKQVARESLY